MGVLAIGCAKELPQSDPGTTAAAAMRGAEEIGAQDVPKAALHLQLAKENLEAAEALEKDGKEDEAASLLMRAEADAELALLLAREQKETDEAAAAMERVRKLKEDNS